MAIVLPVNGYAAGYPAGAPEWVLTPLSKGPLAASGSAVIGDGGIGAARLSAVVNARDELARIIGVKIENIIQVITTKKGIENSGDIEKSITEISRQTASQILKGSRQVDKKDIRDVIH